MRAAGTVDGISTSARPRSCDLVFVGPTARRLVSFRTFPGAETAHLMCTKSAGAAVCTKSYEGNRRKKRRDKKPNGGKRSMFTTTCVRGKEKEQSGEREAARAETKTTMYVEYSCYLSSRKELPTYRGSGSIRARGSCRIGRATQPKRGDA